jgi:hypothetical protein
LALSVLAISLAWEEHEMIARSLDEVSWKV